MSHFVDVTLRPNPEIPSHALLSAVYAKAHEALVARGEVDLAISFPQYALRPPSLGSRMRLIGAGSALQAILQTAWLHGMEDFVMVSTVEPVPGHAEHRILRRVQAKSSPERLRRRLMKRHGLDPDEAAARIPDNVATTLRLPFIEVRSRSTRQPFRLFLRLSSTDTDPVEGTFNSYGLSHAATIPWF